MESGHKKSWYKFCNSETFLKQTISFQSGNPGKQTWSQPLNRDVNDLFIHRESYQCSHLTNCCRPLPVDICNTQSILTREHCCIQYIFLNTSMWPGCQTDLLMHRSYLDIKLVLQRELGSTSRNICIPWFWDWQNSLGNGAPIFFLFSWLVQTCHHKNRNCPAVCRDTLHHTIPCLHDSGKTLSWRENRNYPPHNSTLTPAHYQEHATGWCLKRQVSVVPPQGNSGEAWEKSKPTQGALQFSGEQLTWLFPFWDGPLVLPLACSSSSTSEASSTIPIRGSNVSDAFALCALMGAR